jgi:hypothetical protein
LWWVGLVVSAVLLEFSVALAVITRNAGPYVSSPPGPDFQVMKGSYVVTVPHEAAGSWPADGWYRLLENSLLGFTLRLASSGAPPRVTRVTMVAIPCWLAALISGMALYGCTRQLGLRFIWRRKPGFDVVVKEKD